MDVERGRCSGCGGRAERNTGTPSWWHVVLPCYLALHEVGMVHFVEDREAATAEDVANLEAHHDARTGG